MTNEPKEKDIDSIAKSETDFSQNSSIIETTYEKVLSIIKKVKEFIKKSSSEANSLIEDLEWVIKVITNKSLYSYKLKKEKNAKQNAEYNKFINFVSKYNEEIIEMNKKHDIVSGIFSLGKKREMLMRPSLCLKKTWPQDLQNANQNVEKKGKKQNNFIYVFGNYVLGLYHKEIEKRKRESCKTLASYESIEKEKKNMNEQQEEIKNNNVLNKDTISKDDKNLSIVKPAKIKSRQKSEDALDMGNNFLKNYNSDENNLNQNQNRLKKSPINNNIINNITNDKKSANIQKIKIFTEKDNKIISNKLKLKKINEQDLAQNLSQRKLLYKSISKLTKNEKETLNDIKKVMKNYYLQFAYTEYQTPPQITLKNNINNNTIFNNYNNYGNRIPYKTNYQLNNEFIKKNRSNNIEKGQIINTPKVEILSNNNMTDRNKFNSKKLKKNNENKSVFKNQRLIKSIQNNLNLDSNDDRFDPFNFENNNYYISKRAKLQFSKSKRLQIEAENKNNSFIKENNDSHKINNINDNQINIKTEFHRNKQNNERENIKNDNSIIIEENIKVKENDIKIPLKSLVEKYMADLKMITDPDFDIFVFQNKVTYINVLPIMGYIILETLGLIDKKIISTKKLDSFLYTVSKNYKQTTLYHNGLHGADVAQSLCIFILNSNAEEICETSVLDLLGLIVSALGHDLGHPGLNNNFHINAGTDLGITYNDASCLENYHSSYLFRILRKEENNIIEKLSVNNYKNLRKRMIAQILATDMANHGENISLIRTKVNTWKEEGQPRFNLLSGNEKTKFEEQQLLLNYLIHMADLGHNCKKYEISIQWVKLLTEEFWRQGDLEKKKGLPISFLCDRDKIDVPSSQVNFLKGFILSSFDCLVAIFPKLKYTIENAENNIKTWQKLQNEKRMLGWSPKKKKEQENKDNDKK